MHRRARPDHRGRTPHARAEQINGGTLLASPAPTLPPLVPYLLATWPPQRALPEEAVAACWNMLRRG
jgi:hypothetical protein